MCAELRPLSHLAIPSHDDYQIAVHHGKNIYKSDFIAEVHTSTAYFATIASQDIALYYQDAYPFSVVLYAVLHSDKNVWIAGNNKTATANKLKAQGCLLIGEWPDNESSINEVKSSSIKISPLNLDQPQLTIFTSGSNGEPKAIKKTLRQFQNEIEVLEQQWGQGLGQRTAVLSTVSHQHIYGLIFRILWPMAAKRCFYSKIFLSPEALLKMAAKINVYWIASPAQLKRLDEQTDWQSIAKLTTIFSSGGALSIKSATQIYKNAQHKVIEVYGSSETGGIAWRQSLDNPLWTLFKTLSITKDAEGKIQLSSPFLQQQIIRLDDKIKLNGKGQFALLGRADRIVKVEEKRLSLDELEQGLNQSEWVQQSYTFLLTNNNRDITAAVLILTETGKDLLKRHDKAELIKPLKKQLMLDFETVVLPKKWLFMQQHPLTTQGKIDQPLLETLLTLDSTRFPVIQFCDVQINQVVLQLKAQAGLLYFNGHFPEQPILPGVTQLAWVERFGKLFFNIKQPFLTMEVIKFKKIIRPDSLIRMELNWKIETGKLYFNLRCSEDLFSSGRMVYRVH